MKKRLFIIRHAQAEDFGYSSMLKDFDRNLTSKGIMQSARLGSFIYEEKEDIGCLVTSPANRTLQTAQVFAEQFGFGEDAVKLETNLYDGGPKAYLACLNGLEERFETAAIFGHNPDITFFAEYLTRDDVGGNMKKASLIELVFTDLKWAEISSNSGEFVRRVNVKELAPEL